MKLLIVMPSATKHGGAEVALLQLTSVAKESGLDLHVVFLSEGDMPDEVRQYGVSVSVIEAGQLRDFAKFIKAVASLRKEIVAFRPDAVLGWMTKAHIYSGLAALTTNHRAVYFQHGLPDNGWVDIISRSLPACGALACSEFVASLQKRKVRHPVLPVRMGSDFELLHPGDGTKRDAKKALGIDQDSFLIGIVARLQRWKAVHVYLEAMSKVVAQVPHATGIVIGGRHEREPDYPEYLQELRRSLGLEDKVVMAGKQSNIRQWMRAMDVFVHASEKEPFGIVVVEALASGVPVVASRPGGPEEIIHDGVNGLLVPSGNADALASALCRLAANPSEAEDMKLRGLDRAKDFSVANYVRSLRSALEELCLVPVERCCHSQD